MPQVVITEAAAQSMERCARFLSAKSPAAAQRASQAIKRQLLLLKSTPDIGRPAPEYPSLRELIIAFGGSGYVALYRYEPAEDTVFILAFRHQKEASYTPSPPR